MLRAVAVALATALFAAASADPLACQPNDEQPMLPIYHIIGNVTKNSDNSIQLEPINDASAVTFYEGIYHVWHQCCQNHWDHVISKDLIHWQRLPPPIQPVNLRTFDGSIAMLSAEDGGPAILYDAQDGKEPRHGPNGEVFQPEDKPILGVARLADPQDKYLMTWTREPNNPVEFEGQDNCFPGPIWKNGNHYNMVMQGDRYQSPDKTFHNWKNMGPMVGEREHSGQWWMPVPNQIDGSPPPSGPTDPNRLVNVGGGETYLFGHYNNASETFTTGATPKKAKLEGGRGQWWGASGGADNNGRMMMVGWAEPDFHGDAGPGIKFLTRLTGLREVNYDAKTKTLVANPVPELKGLRTRSVASEKAVALPAGGSHAVAGTNGGKAASTDVIITFSGFATATGPATFGACVLGSTANATSGLGIKVIIGQDEAGRTATVSVGSCGQVAKAGSDFTATPANATCTRVMNNTNFPHGDIRGKDHGFPPGTTYEACQTLCDNTPACHAWTFLKRGPGMSCCIKGAINISDGCPHPAPGMISGAKVAGTYLCADGGGGRRPPGPPASTVVPLFDEPEVEVRIMPDRSLADFFVAGGRWAGTLAWPIRTPRAAPDSQISLWSSGPGIKADIDVWGMGCGWLTPSYTDSPSI